MAYEVPEITVRDSDEFQEMIDNKDFIIAETIVNGIFANVDNPRKNIHLLSIVCIDEGAVYDITVEKKHFATTLEENLVHYVREEKYEDCQKIADMISELKGKQLSELIYSVSGSK